MASSPLAVPVKLDAFVFNPDACNGTEKGQAKIAPIGQPNYSYLRIKDFMLQNDVLRPIELHGAAPASRNSRITDLATGQVRTERMGVYLHWMIPRPYRSGAAKTGAANASRAHRGVSASTLDAQAPVFPETPNRWLVIRKLAGDVQPPQAKLEPVTAWVVESDWMRTIDELDDTSNTKMDLQVDVSPYLTAAAPGTRAEPSVDQQAEIFIGGRVKAKDWDGESSKAKKRVSLGVLNSSNQLFPDYQPHNSNVYSMLDSFEYTDAETGKTRYATSAAADYHVLGWHDDAEQDIMCLDPGSKTRGDRIRALSMALNPSSGGDVAEWLNARTNARVLCHGAMYGVQWHSKWDASTKPRVPADEAARALANLTPIAVGTTPLDALLSYVCAHQSGPIEKLLCQLSDLLQAQSDSIEDRRAGADEVQNYNFARFAGGTRYLFQKDPKKPASPPSDKAAHELKLLNENQALCDAAVRQLQKLQWEFFAVWWRYVTDVGRDQDKVKRGYVSEVAKLNERWGALETALVREEAAVADSKTSIEKMALTLKEAVAPSFSQQRDPTLFVSGVQAGWPLDYLDSLLVRLHSQIEKRPGSPPDPTTYGIRCLPTQLQGMAATLVSEFLHYGSKDSAEKDGTAGRDVFPPLYHDGRDAWNNSQPWFPLFLEWEAEYYHVPYQQWTMDEKASRADQDKKFRYTVKQDGLALWETENTDRRTISGRILLLPQPVFSLHAQVDRLFSTVPEAELAPILPPDEREKVLAEIRKLPFVSAPLDGFANHLLTLADGSHLKPNVRYPGERPQPMKEAYEDSQKVGLGRRELDRIGPETDLTPYASLVRLGGLTHPAFKPVTHGQFKLTKLNIVDKFGQAAPALDTTRRLGGPHPIFPCIGEYYEPQEYRNTGYPNVVEKPEQPGDCQFMQVPPSINQPARLHMNFVKLDKHDEYHWRPVTEWETPIWGWVLVNYVNYGVQFFLHDGTFYREVRVADPNNPGHGTHATDKWLPFKPPKKPDTVRQLDRLIGQFTGDGGRPYLLAFMDTINIAMQRASSVPGAYSQCVNSLIGRPLALVNAGFSLELATDERKNQSTVGNQPDLLPPYSLLPNSGMSGEPSIQYEFPIKLGDTVRPHDGLVGYFNARKSPRPEDELELGDMFTPFESGPDKKYKSDQIHPIDKETMFKLKAYWLDPKDYKGPGAAGKYMVDANKKLTVCGLLMDPFTPVNAYSSILPIEPLLLPSWTWESALKKMTAFFHFGPLLVEDDVPAFCSDWQLKPKYDLEKETVEATIKLPSLAVAEWSWLQPYPDPEQGGGQVADEVYMALQLGKVDPMPEFAAGPLTAVEGFLQMKRPITAPVEGGAGN
ncbi:hypothetical protein H634G_09276 [Metarhizium anisopliae BRIP 53293]|uniref:Uncharacterized protein n=1 Tax=Metarhizium anisopliae BRIP 53293 TaxID=1291518 RepID=A0A0D9NPT4_METAN|nr:hypothetical protein H634G_09276 [Metarhizium anisopliae BRIP 53293]KJK85505.1 hypothetical protein H633G_10653 [Metarhizium anisopliae BRIP 53284]